MNCNIFTVIWLSISVSSLCFAKEQSEKTKTKTPSGMLKDAYEDIKYWGGEPGTDDARIKEINAGVRKDCTTGMKLIDKFVKAKTKDSELLGPALQIINSCTMVSASAKRWKKSIAKYCGDATPYFASRSPSDDPDAQSTFLMMCPDDAAKLYNKKN